MPNSTGREKLAGCIVECKAEIEEEVCRNKKESLWETILRESEHMKEEFKNEFKHSSLHGRSLTPQNDSDYLDKEIFPFVLPAMEEMLLQAKEWNALSIQKRRFNGLDYLAEALWNRNPRHSIRTQKWLQAFDIPNFKLILRLCPRPIFPKSWLWSEEEAALHIQRYVRGWLVRKRDDVQEMRQFWKALQEEDKLSVCSIAETTRDPQQIAKD